MTDHATPSRTVPSRRRLWLGLATPPVVWALHSLSAFFVAVGLCRGGHQLLTRLLILALTAAGVVGCGVAGVVAYGCWTRLRDGQRLIEAEGRGQDEMLAIGGLFTASMFALAILWNGTQSMLMGHLCEGGR
jgi:hypothetical protein